MGMIKNIASAGRGLGVKGHGNISFAPGEVREVSDAVIAEARKDPANAATLTEEGGLVVIDEMADAARATIAAKKAAEAAAAQAAKAEQDEAELAKAKGAATKSKEPEQKPAGGDGGGEVAKAEAKAKGAATK